MSVKQPSTLPGFDNLDYPVLRLVDPCDALRSFCNPDLNHDPRFGTRRFKSSYPAISPAGTGLRAGCCIWPVTHPATAALAAPRTSRQPPDPTPAGSNVRLPTPQVVHGPGRDGVQRTSYRATVLQMLAAFDGVARASERTYQEPAVANFQVNRARPAASAVT